MFNQTNGEPGPAASFAVVDPTLVQLSDDNDEDFPPAHMILPKVAWPAVKVAGSRRTSAPDVTGKGKAEASVPLKGPKHGASTALEEPEAKKQCGWAAGVVNYSSDDLDALLDILEETLPIGAKAWNSAGEDFCALAIENGRPACTMKSLEAKYKQVFFVIPLFDSASFFEPSSHNQAHR